MANGVQLATAYISLNVRTDDIKKQVTSALDSAGKTGSATGSAIGRNISNSIRSHLGSVGTLMFAPMEVAGVRWAVKAGATIGGALKKAIMGAVGGLGLGAIFGVGGVLTAGLDRLKTIQRAQVQLSLKLDPNEIKRVTKDIQEVVRGTPIALDEALQAVPRALSAGIKPGQELSQYVKDIADAAASTGGQAGFGQIDIIFSQILGKGKLMGEELMQLTENGVDLRSALKDAFNWDDKTLNKNIEKGKVTMKEVQKAVEQAWGKDGGLAKKMGGTFDGAIGNLKAATARLGANILGTIFGDPNNTDGDPLRGAINGVGALTEKLDTAGKWVATHRDDIRGFFKRAADGASTAWNGVKKVWEWLVKAKDVAAEVGNKIAAGFNTAKSALDGFINRIQDIWTSLKTWVLDKWDSAFGPNSAMGKFLSMIGVGVPSASAADTGTTNTGPKAPGLSSGGSFSVGGGRGMSTTGSLGGSPLGSNPFDFTLGPGANQPFNLGAQSGIAPSGYVGDSALLSRIPSGRYVTANEFASGNVENLGDLTQGLGDCTSAIQDLVAIIEGQPTGGRSLSNGQSMYTGTIDQWAAEHGFLPTNVPMPGTFQVGANDVHAQATLPGGTPFNWGSKEAAAVRGMDNSLGAWDPSFTKHYYKKYGSGGDIRGAGTGTSDSIPAMLSNGEHVLTASDVQKMGGQQGVYAFRAALQNGMIPGFAPGGAVDPTDPTLINPLQDMNNAAIVAQQKFMETMNNTDATAADIMGAQQDMVRTQRELQQYQTDLPLIAAGLTPPDRSKQNRVLDLTDQLALADQRMKDQAASGNDIPLSQQTAQQYQLEALKRDRSQAINDLTGQGKKPDYGMDFLRSMGFVPAAAGSNAKAGTSSLAGFINMGSEIVGGLIDTGTNLGQMAVSAAIAAGAAGASSGAGAAAVPVGQAAASYGVQLAGNLGKVTADYWYGLAGIGVDSLMEIFSPFGMPRWMGYDYTQFAPQLGLQQAFSSTLEKMGGEAIKNAFGQGPQNPMIPPDPTTGQAGNTNTAPSGPASSGSMSVALPDQAAPPQQPAQVGGGPGMTNTGTVDLNPITTLNPMDAGGAGGGGSWARGGAIGIYDNGGVLKPGDLALNASKTPESILTKAQWTAMMDNASSAPSASGPLVQNLYAQDMQDAIRQLQKVQSRNMMQYAGRS